MLKIYKIQEVCDIGIDTYDDESQSSWSLLT